MLGPGVVVALVGMSAGSLAEDVGNGGDDDSRFKSHDLRDRRGRILPTGGAKCGQGLGAISQGRSVGSTATVAAATAVDPRKHILNPLQHGVGVNPEKAEDQ